MTSEVDGFLVEWHRIVSEKDLGSLAGVLAEDVSIGAPPYWGKLRGRGLVQHLLGLIVDTIDEFSYHREWRNGRELALEFSGRVDDRELQGIDLISLNERMHISNLDVLMRPALDLKGGKRFRSKGRIFGMPIIDVDKAHTVIVIKRSLSPGFAGIPNPLFAMDNALMMFGDGKKALLELAEALKEG